MKLVIIYGPPAVGKLTVAQVLAKATGFKLLHNHLVSDLVLSVFSRSTPGVANLGGGIRNLIFEAAAKSGIAGIINTFLYDRNKKGQVEEWTQECIETLRRHRVDIFFVRLSCNMEALKLRVVNHSRSGTKKITSIEKLIQVIKDEGSFGEIPENIIKSLHIDNTHLKPEEVAEQIISHCGLQKIAKLDGTRYV